MLHELGKRKVEDEMKQGESRKRMTSRAGSSDVIMTNCSSKVVDLGIQNTARDSTHKRTLSGEEKSFAFPEQLPFMNKIRRSLSFVDSFVCETESFATGSVTLVSISEKEKALIHLICKFLEPTCVVALSLVSKKILFALDGFPLDLCTMNRSFSASEINFWFKQTCSKVSHVHSRWRISSVKVSLEDSEQDEFFSLLHHETLKELIISGSSSERFDVSFLKQCRKMKLLDTGMFCEHISGLDSFQHLTQLECLYLRNAQNISDVSFLGRTSMLTELSFYMCSNLASIQGLEQCRALKVLDFGGCLPLADISPLSNCFQLEQISFAECQQIKSIAPICSAKHNKLYHLDLIGCKALEDLDQLNHLVSLKSIKAFRTNVCQLMNLVFSSNKWLATHAWDVVKANGIFDLDELAPHLIHTLRRSEHLPQKNMKKIVQLIVSLTHHEMASQFFLDAGAPETLIDIAFKNTNALNVQGLCLTALRNICQRGSFINDVATQETMERLFHILRCLLGKNVPSKHNTCKGKRVAQCIECCSSILLFIAADSRARHNLLIWFSDTLEILYKVLKDGTFIAQAEAAGALWNLSASLEIGQMVINIPGLIQILIEVMKSSPSLPCRVQAAGALRNLAIVPSNKRHLIDNGILAPLLQICSDRARQLENKSYEKWAENEDSQLLLFKAISIIRILVIHDAIAETIDLEDLMPSLFILASKEYDSRVMRQACGAILALSCHEFGRAKLYALGGVQILLNVLSNPDPLQPAVISCLGALWYLAAELTPWSKELLSQVSRVLTRWINSDNSQIRIRATGISRCLCEINIEN